MNIDVKDAWIAALRGGEYQQTQAALKKDIGFCCLGVLCDLYIETTGLGSWVKSDDIYLFIYGAEEDFTAGYLPQCVQDWAGLKEKDPPIGGASLAEFNDNGKSFSEIATLIERKL